MHLWIVRGLPGSGKSTYAKSLNIFHVEADMYYMRDSCFDWKAADLNKAHEFSQYTVAYALRRGMDVVVANTFTTKKEVEPYLRMAEDFGAKVNIITCTGTYGSIHDVPVDVMIKMKNRWQKIDGEVFV